MEKHYCDRCGKEMATCGNTLEGAVAVGEKTLQLQAFIFAKDEDGDEYTEDVDLCPTCHEVIIADLVKMNATA